MVVSTVWAATGEGAMEEATEAAMAAAQAAEARAAEAKAAGAREEAVVMAAVRAQCMCRHLW